MAEIADFLLLQIVNRAQPLVAHFDAMTGLHPETLYPGERGSSPANSRPSASATGAPPLFPVYRHDRLKETFTPVIDALRLR